VKALMIFRPISLPVQQLRSKEKKYAGEGQNSQVKPVVLQNKNVFKIKIPTQSTNGVTEGARGVN
jgi:hypothetical protein